MKNLIIALGIILIIIPLSQQSCFSSVFCSNPKPFCVDYECSQCRNGYDCPGALTQCVKGSCKDCLKDSDCKLGSKKKCNTSNVCVECIQKSDCTNPALPYCPVNTCVECIQNSDCSGNSDTCNNNVCTCGSSPKCKLSCQASQCLECLTVTDCPSNLLCSAKNKCVQCLTKSDCKQFSIAKCSNNVCQEKCAANEDCIDNTDNCSNGKCYCGKNAACKIACSNGQCLQCRTKDDCASGKQCSSQNMCVDCVKDDNCGGSLPKCYQNICAQCANNVDCTGLTNTCTNGTCFCGTQGPCTIGCVKGQCIQCLDDGQCPKNKKCSSLNTCVQCVNDSQCIADKLKCNVQTGTCKQCNLNSHCTGKTDTCTEGTCTCGIFGACDTYCINGACVECISNADCKNTKVCSSQNSCVQCISDQDCPIRPKKCKDNACLQCQEHGHCKGKGDYCVNGQCKCGTGQQCDKYCNNNGQCEDCKTDSNCFWGNRKYCLQASRCVECLTNDHCSNGQKCFQNTCSQCAVNTDCTGNSDTCNNGICQCGANAIFCLNKKCQNGKCEALEVNQKNLEEINIQNMINNIQIDKSLRNQDIFGYLSLTFREFGSLITPIQQIEILEIMEKISFKLSNYQEVISLTNLMNQLIQLKTFSLNTSNKHHLSNKLEKIDSQFSRKLNSLMIQLEIQMIKQMNQESECEQRYENEVLLVGCKVSQEKGMKKFDYHSKFLDNPLMMFKVMNENVYGVGIIQLSKRIYQNTIDIQSNVFQITIFSKDYDTIDDENIQLTFDVVNDEELFLQNIENELYTGQSKQISCNLNHCQVTIQSGSKYFITSSSLKNKPLTYLQTSRSLLLDILFSILIALIGL